MSKNFFGSVVALLSPSLFGSPSFAEVEMTTEHIPNKN